MRIIKNVIWQMLIRFFVLVCQFLRCVVECLICWGCRGGSFTLEKYLLDVFAEKPVPESKVVHSAINVSDGGSEGAPASETQS